MKRFMISAVALLLSTTFAFADDTGKRWQGVYLGIQAGGVWSGDVDIREAVPGIVNGLQGETDLKGLLGGAHLGYLHQHQSIVFGIELRGNIANVDGNNGACLANGGTTIASCTATAKYLGAVMAKVGVDLGQFMVFGQAGYALAGFDASAGVVGSPLTFQETDLASGIAYGLGGSFQLTDRWRITVDWTRYDLDASGSLLPALSSGEREYKFDAITAGVSFQLSKPRKPLM